MDRSQFDVPHVAIELDSFRDYKMLVDAAQTISLRRTPGKYERQPDHWELSAPLASVPRPWIPDYSPTPPTSTSRPILDFAGSEA